MKAYLLSLFLLVPAVASAEEIQNIRNVEAVQVKRVEVSFVGEGFPLTEVKAEAEFGNSCLVPSAEELVTIVNYSKNFDSLVIALGNQSERICPMVYAPVMVTINVGRYIHPADGTFKRVKVNEVKARRAE